MILLQDKAAFLQLFLNQSINLKEHFKREALLDMYKAQQRTLLHDILLCKCKGKKLESLNSSVIERLLSSHYCQ